MNQISEEIHFSISRKIIKLTEYYKISEFKVIQPLTLVYQFLHLFSLLIFANFELFQLALMENDQGSQLTDNVIKWISFIWASISSRRILVISQRRRDWIRHMTASPSSKPWWLIKMIWSNFEAAWTMVLIKSKKLSKISGQACKRWILKIRRDSKSRLVDIPFRKIGFPQSSRIVNSWI